MVRTLVFGMAEEHNPKSHKFSLKEISGSYRPFSSTIYQPTYK
jgi:hypothetical protein